MGGKIYDLDEYVSLSKNLIMKLIEQPCNFNFNEKGELVIINDYGELVTLKLRSQEIPDLEEVIPQYFIDIDCGEKISQQKEAEVCWKILVINSVHNGLYKQETISINSDAYGFLKLKGNLLESILESKN